MDRVRVTGTSYLQEIHKAPITLFQMVLSLDFNVEGRPMPWVSRVENIIINIPEEQYEFLKKKFEDIPKATHDFKPTIKIKGDLHFSLGDVPYRY